MKPNRPCVVTTDAKFPDMIVMAMDNRVAAFLLRCVGAVVATDSLTTDTYDALHAIPEVSELYQYLADINVDVKLNEMFEYEMLLKGTKWEVAK